MNDYWWIVAKYNVGRAIKEKKWRGRLSNIATCFNASRRVQPAASKEQDWDEQPRRFHSSPGFPTQKVRSRGSIPPGYRRTSTPTADSVGRWRFCVSDRVLVNQHLSLREAFADRQAHLLP